MAEAEKVAEGAGAGMWLRLLWQMKELLPLLGRMLPLLEGWVAGNVGASAGTQKVLAQLEAQVGSSQQGLDGIAAQLQSHGTVLLHLSKEMQQLRSQGELERADREATIRAMAAEIAGLKKLLVALVLGVGLLVVGVVIELMMLRRLRG